MTGEPHTREALVTLLWPELEPSRARAGLRRNLSTLRKALDGEWLIVALATGSGAVLRLLLAGQWGALLAWAVGAAFIPTLALALGVWSGSSKMFEVVYFLLWYAGPIHQVPALDYMGARPEAVKPAPKPSL